MGKWKKRGILVTASIIIVIVLARWVFRPDVDRQMLENIEILLDDYSHRLDSGDQSESTAYSPQMQALIQERRQFYTDYLETGLKSNLETITSNFDFVPRTDASLAAMLQELPESTRWDALFGRTVTVQSGARVRALADGYYSVQVDEMVTLFARYSVPPEKHPVVLGAQWALERTNNPHVRQQLESHKQSYLEDTRESYEEGYELTLILHHRMLMKRTETTLQIVEDVFTDQDAIFSGFDHVTWTDGNFVRDASEITNTTEYLIYQKSVEEIGRDLLRRYGGETTPNAEPSPTNSP